MRTLVLTLAAVACACGFGLVQLERPRAAQASTHRVERVDLTDEIDGLRADAWRLEALMGLRRTPASAVTRKASPSYQRWVLRLWSRRTSRLWRHAQRPPHRNEWLCIHRHEGPWGANTGNGYYGGLQMDVSFQRLYGGHLLRRKGTADRWTPLEQMWVAERAHRAGRGFYPWPNTARSCGLL